MKGTMGEDLIKMNVFYNGFSNDDEVIKRIKESRLPVVMGGYGSVAHAAERKLRANGVENVTNVLIDTTAYYIKPRGEALPEEYIFLHGFLGSYGLPASRFRKMGGTCSDVLYLSEIYDTEPITHSFYKEHAREFEETYRSLNDDLSRLSMDAYLNAKINEDASGLRMLVQKPQYFSPGFLKLGKGEALVDCGAFRGDSIDDFVHTVDRQYRKIYAFEPDGDNISALEDYVRESNLHDVTIIKKGASDKAGSIRFSSNAEMSRADVSGEMEITTDAIDSVVVEDDVTYIKMDIEGAELAALRGARRTIQRCHPALAISAYHKADDLIALYREIEGNHMNYKYYFRLHKEIAVDAVLYAVPY